MDRPLYHLLAPRCAILITDPKLRAPTGDAGSRSLTSHDGENLIELDANQLHILPYDLIFIGPPCLRMSRRSMMSRLARRPYALILLTCLWGARADPVLECGVDPRAECGDAGYCTGSWAAGHACPVKATRNVGYSEKSGEYRDAGSVWRWQTYSCQVHQNKKQTTRDRKQR